MAPSAVWIGANVPHAPFTTLPVIGLPPHVTTQSTPALRRSPLGIMLSGSGDATASVVTFEPVKTIGPAIAPAPEAPPHPVAMDSTETSEITPAQTRDEARSRWERTREPIRVDGLREVVCRGLKRSSPFPSWQSSVATSHRPQAKPPPALVTAL